MPFDGPDSVCVSGHKVAALLYTQHGVCAGLCRAHSTRKLMNLENMGVHLDHVAKMMSAQHYTSALDLAHRCLELDPQSVRALLYTGSCHMHLSEYRLAVPLLKKGAQLDRVRPLGLSAP